MTDTAPHFTPQQRNGRQILVLAITLLGAIPLLTLFIKGSGPVALIGYMLFYGVIFSFAYKGGQIALGLLKGVSLLSAFVFTILLCTLAIWHFGEVPLPEGSRKPHPLEIIAPAAFAYFALWAFFFSKSVRTFLDLQRSQRTPAA